MSAPPDPSFVRQGRPLAAWVPELVVEDEAVRCRAGEALQAMYFGVPSMQAADAHVADDAHRRKWAAAVADAVAGIEGGAGAFLERLAARILAGAAEAEQDFADSADDGDGDRTAAGLIRNMVLQNVFIAAGPALLAARGAIAMLRASRTSAYIAAEAVAALGPAGAPLLGPGQLETFWDSDFTPEALAAVGGKAIAPAMLAMIERNGPRNDHRSYFDAVSAGLALAQLGPTVCERPNLRRKLDEWAGAAHPNLRCAAAAALAGAGPADPRATATLLALSADRDPRVQGYAIESLGLRARQPETVVPRLVELLDEFEEFDCDEGYGGEHSRVCRALERYGPAAAAAAPRLIELLAQELSSDDDDDYPPDLVAALAAIGPPARAALPLLRRVARQADLDDEQTAGLARAIRAIEGSPAAKPPLASP